jgi:hypothetical protein
MAALIRKAAHLLALPSTALGIVLAIMPISVRAETKVRGTPQAVVVEAANAPVEEVLVALTENFKVRLASTSGSLEHTKARCSRRYLTFSKATTSS